MRSIYIHALSNSPHPFDGNSGVNKSEWKHYDFTTPTMCHSLKEFHHRPNVTTVHNYTTTVCHLSQKLLQKLTTLTPKQTVLNI